MLKVMKETVDFIVIGAQKAGTTSLFEHLKRHPEISLPAGKEAPYFSHDAAYARGWKNFMTKAAFGDPSCKWGTVSPLYMVGGVYEPLGAHDGHYDERTVPSRIQEHLPDVRMIAILRDPVDRAFSHYRMMVMNGFERRSFDEAIRGLLHPAALDSSRRQPEETAGYVTWGEYGRILAGYFDVFVSEQILVIFTDELERAPERLLYRVHEFLGVTPGLLPDNLRTRYRVGGSERRISWLSPHRTPSPQGLQRNMERNVIARKLWHGLPDASRRRMRRSYEAVGHRIDLWNRRDSENAVRPSEEAAALLRTHFAQDTARLAALIEAEPPWQQQ